MLLVFVCIAIPFLPAFAKRFDLNVGLPAVQAGRGDNQMKEKDDDLAHPGMVPKPEKTPNFGSGFNGSTQHQLEMFDEGSLRRILSSYFNYYHRSRTHLSLEKDSPERRPIQPPEIGPVVAYPRSVDCITATNNKHLK